MVCKGVGRFKSVGRSKPDRVKRLVAKRCDSEPGNGLRRCWDGDGGVPVAEGSVRKASKTQTNEWTALSIQDGHERGKICVDNKGREGRAVKYIPNVRAQGARKCSRGKITRKLAPFRPFAAALGPLGIDP